MSLSDLASLGSFVGALAVVASLIYLALQVHQNSKHTRALIFQGGAARRSNEYLTMADADLAAVLIRGNGGEATSENIQRTQFNMLWCAHYVHWDDAFRQYQLGLMGDEDFGRFRAALVGDLVRNLGFRELYTEGFVRETAVESGFHKFIDAAVVEAEAIAARSAKKGDR